MKHLFKLICDTTLRSEHPNDKLNSIYSIAEMAIEKLHDIEAFSKPNEAGEGWNVYLRDVDGKEWQISNCATVELARADVDSINHVLNILITL